MRKTDSYWNGFTLREWHCECGALYQLLLSKRYPERWFWKPHCECKKKGKQMNDQNVSPVAPELDPAKQDQPKREVFVQTEADIGAVEDQNQAQ